MMMLMALLLAAASASAQIGGGGMGGMGGRRGGGRGGMGGMNGMERVGREQNMKFPSAKSLEKYNPADLVIDKHKKLNLADSQQEQFKGLRQQIFERNATLMTRYDSLQRDFRPPQFSPQRGGESSPAVDSTRRVAMVQMRQLRMLVDSLLDHRRADVHDVLSALTDEAQRKKAAEYLDKQDIDFAKEFPQPPAQRNNGDDSTGRGGYGGGRGGRRPPA
jgi:hypothetical protein